MAGGGKKTETQEPGAPFGVGELLAVNTLRGDGYPRMYRGARCGGIAADESALRRMGGLIRVAYVQPTFHY